MSRQPTLDCQDCGSVVRKLNEEETQMVATSPYNYVVYCASCKRDLMKGDMA